MPIIEERSEVRHNLLLTQQQSDQQQQHRLWLLAAPLFIVRAALSL